MRNNFIRHILYLLTSFIVLMLLSNCKNRGKDVDVSGISLNIKIDRFEKDLFAINLDSISQQLPALKSKYGEFFNIFNYEIIQIEDTAATDYTDKLLSFLTDNIVNQDYNSTIEVFPQLDKLENELTQAFKHYLYYFPGMPVPQVITFISGFNQSVVTADSILGIGLDNYLGTDCEYYTRLGINAYQKYTMRPEMIPFDCMQAWAQMEFPEKDSSETLLSKMIYNGKILYFMQTMIPDRPDSMLIGYSKSQYIWCEKNEKQMWIYLIENKLLFSTDFMNVNKFINNGPYSKDFSRESPGKAGVWIGWQIIKSYMEKNSTVSLPELMHENNSMEILRNSRYNP